jgi:hypothetical protein
VSRRDGQPPREAPPSYLGGRSNARPNYRWAAEDVAGHVDDDSVGAWGASSATRPVNCGFACQLGYRAAALTAASEATLRAAQTRLPDPVSLHPAAPAARPRGRQGPRDPGPTPPAHRAAPPGPTAQAGTCRSGPERRGQPRAATSPLVLLPGHTPDLAALASPPGRRRLDLPTSRTRPSTTR